MAHFSISTDNGANWQSCETSDIEFSKSFVRYVGFDRWGHLFEGEVMKFWVPVLPEGFEPEIDKLYEIK